MALNISKFLNQFFMEADEKLANIQDHMLELENNPKDKDAIENIQRDMHTIKGSARMVGLKEISQIAHLMEEAFTRFHSGRVPVSAPVMTVMYRAVDSIAQLLNQARDKKPYSDTSPLEDEIQQVIDGKVHPPGESTAIKGETDAPSRRKFKLDFNTLKQKIKHKIPAPEKKPPPETAQIEPEPPELFPPEPAITEPAMPEPAMLEPEPGKPEIIPSPVMEKTYLKVHNHQVETLINQVTDLLSRRYFFNNVMRTSKELLQMIRGLRTEWLKIKNAEPGQYTGDLEAVNNVDNTVEVFLKKIQDFQRDYQVNLTNFEGALRDVYDNLLDVKLTPLNTIFNIYPRFVRDYAYRTGKQIKIYIRGGDTQLDKTVIEKINEPLIHLIRNACDHGIETPEERQKHNKTPVGTIIIEANKKGSHVEIKISDDGRGLDAQSILDKAVRQKLIDPESAEQLDEQEIYDFIFETGFSTASEVTDISGRGVGMDVVRKITQQFGGSIDIQTEKNKGTHFHLQFPISIFTNQVTYIREEGIEYALPSSLIRSIVRVYPRDIIQKTDYSVVVHNHEIYTVAKLNQVLSGETQGIGDKPLFMILPKITEKKIGIIVDDILHESEVIVKELGPFLGKRRFVYGMVIGERGELHIVLDIHDVVASEAFSKKIKILTPLRTRETQKYCVLVVDDSMLVREMEKNVLESGGYEVVTAVNGIDGYNRALTRRFDLVLADIEMPEMDGFEMIENIKKIDEYADVPTIVLSTVEKEEDKIRGLNLGVNAWLQKQDFDEKEMLKIIKRLIG